MGRLSHKTETFNNHNSEYKLSYSAGWAFTIGGGKSTLKELLDIADSNMYDAKRQHKENL